MVKGSFHARLRRTCSSDENIVKFSGTPFLSIAHDVQPFWSELWVSLHLVRTEPIDSYPSHLSPFLSPRYVDYVILRIEWWERRTNTFLSRAVDTGLVSIRLLSDRLPWWDCIERNRHTNSWVCHLSCRYTSWCLGMSRLLHRDKIQRLRNWGSKTSRRGWGNVYEHHFVIWKVIPANPDGFSLESSCFHFEWWVSHLTQGVHFVAIGTIDTNPHVAWLGQRQPPYPNSGWKF